MNSGFMGITFPFQRATPSDDAIIRRNLLSDGILTGCGLSYSGSTLTMEAGQLMICGRQIRHPSAQSWAVVDAASGYARLVFTIDTTLASTTDIFEQVSAVIEYADAVEDFPELEQADINDAGTRYQIEACVVSLGSGGITGIVSQLSMSTIKTVKLLWKNDNLAETFEAQTLPIIASEYPFVSIVARVGYVYENNEFVGYSYRTFIIPTILATQVMGCYNSAASYARTICITESGFEFGSCSCTYSSGMSGYDDDTIVPYLIYGHL